jgi:DnaJ-class molecular chaperone
MDFHKDYYGILGCTADADQAVIQAAYRALAKKYHPDANQGSNESKEKFQEIQEAYETLERDDITPHHSLSF